MRFMLDNMEVRALKTYVNVFGQMVDINNLLKNFESQPQAVASNWLVLFSQT